MLKAKAAGFDTGLATPAKDDIFAGKVADILRVFIGSDGEAKDRFSLRLDNGETFGRADIEELLSREDCPVNG